MAIIVVDQTTSQEQTTFARPLLNFQHFAEPHGILLLVQFVVGIIIFVIHAPWYLDVVSWIAWIVTHLLIWVYLFSLNERYASNPPIKVVEFYFNGGACLLYALCTLFCFIFINWIVGIFAAINTVAYGGSAFFLVTDWNSHRLNSNTGDSTLPK